MSKKQEYLQLCEQYIKQIEQDSDYTMITNGVYLKVLQPATSDVHPNLQSVVTVHYQGRLVTGRVFDDSYQHSCPEAFRLTEVIVGWQVALQQMGVGEKCEVVIAPEQGYGKRSNGPIPGGSVLIFEIELLNIC